MKVIIIDNNDSFTYNLKYYINQFCDIVDVLRSNQFHLDDLVIYDKILFSPGPGLPNEHPILKAILDKYGHSKSIFGVCLGHQAIAEFYGCQLLNLADSMHARSSRIKHLNNCSLFENLPDTFKIGHYHSWVIDNVNFSERLEITSINEDGLIMSIKHKQYNIKAVQFHPESILTEHGLVLIKNWLLN